MGMACKSILQHTNAGKSAFLENSSSEHSTDVGLSSDGGFENGGPLSFEFQKGDRGPPRPVGASSYSKSGPSKWDDAQKWLVNQSSADISGKVKAKCSLAHGKRASNTNQQDWHPTKDGLKPTGALIIPNETEFLRPKALLQNGVFEGTNNASEEAHNFAFAPVPSSPPSSPPEAKSSDSFDFYPITDEPDDMKEVSMYHQGNENEPFLNPTLRTDKPTSDPASYAAPITGLRSVSMRDMGTEMTPLASQEPSQTGTPVQATTPNLHSPVSSGSSTPRRAAPASSPMPDSQNISALEEGPEVSPSNEMGVHLKLGREMDHGKTDNASWTSKEEEDTVASKLLKSIDLEEVKKNVLETRAAAWEEAERAKYMARFRREEAKIQAWENHAKAKAEAEMRSIEVKVERTRSHAHEKLMNKLAAAKRRAEERRAAAEAKRCEQAAKTAHRADRIRETGRVPTPFFSCGFCQ